MDQLLTSEFQDILGAIKHQDVLKYMNMLEVWRSVGPFDFIICSGRKIHADIFLNLNISQKSFVGKRHRLQKTRSPKSKNPPKNVFSHPHGHPSCQYRHRQKQVDQWSMTISLRTTVFSTIVRKTRTNSIFRYFIEFQLLDLYLSWSFCTREPFP